MKHARQVRTRAVLRLREPYELEVMRRQGVPLNEWTYTPKRRCPKFIQRGQ